MARHADEVHEALLARLEGRVERSPRPERSPPVARIHPIVQRNPLDVRDAHAIERPPDAVVRARATTLCGLGRQEEALAMLRHLGRFRRLGERSLDPRGRLTGDASRARCQLRLTTALHFSLLSPHMETAGAEARLSRAPDDPGLRRDLRAMAADGAAFSAMVGLGETYFAAFALAGGLPDRSAAYVSTFPMLAGGLLQLATPAIVVRLGSCRRWVVLCAALQAATFAPLVLAALWGEISAWLLFGCASLYWGLGMGTGPAWNVWAEVLVPAEQRARYFAQRTRVSQLTLLGALGFSAWLLREGALERFAWLFALAAAARGLSALCLAAQSEPAGLTRGMRASPPWRAWTAVRGSHAGRLLGYLLAMQVTVYIAAPFFTPYMLGPLGQSYAEYAALTGAAFLARVAVLPMLGRVAHARGNRFLLRLGSLGIAPLPALWLISDAWLYLLAVQLLAGAVWAALELSTLLAFLEDLEPRERASVLSAFNLASAIAMAVGTAIGGGVMQALGPTPTTYGLIFAVSSAGRLLSLGALRRSSVPEAVLAPDTLRTLALRPSLGGVQRPVLAGLPSAPADPPGAPERDARSADA